MDLRVIFGIYLGSSGMSALIIGIIIFGLLVYDDMRQPDNRFFLALCIAMIFVLATDVLCNIYMQTPIQSASLKLLLALNYASINAYIILYSFYMTAYLRCKAYINTSIAYHMIFVGGIGTILWTVDVYFDTGVFFKYMPGQGYEATGNYWIIALCPVLIMVFDAVLALSFKDRLKPTELLPWIVYAAAPIIALPLVFVWTISFLYHAEVIALLIVFIFEHSQRQKQTVLTEKELTNSKMKLMLSQIQPHFMYNSLNSIYYLIEENPEEAQEAVSTFSDYLRQNINSLKSDAPVLFSEELNHTDAYLYLEKVRFGGKLKVIKEISSVDFLIPPLSLQPLVENAVKHGLGPKGGEGTIIIKVYENEVAYFIDVIDDGVGFEAPSFDDRDNTHTHIGIFNVHSRLASLCGGQLNVKSKKGEGTVSSIQLPKEKQKELRKGDAK